MTLVADLVAGRPEPLLAADRGRVRFIVLNRPEVRNALTRQMRRDFSRVLAEADRDPSVSVIVLTGADPAFSGGVDLRERSAGPPGPPVEPNPARALQALIKPSIAAVNGACVTGALEMALSCGFAIGSDRARFADTHLRVGLFPRWGQGALLTQAIGVRRARQMMLTGLAVDASTALAWGIVNEVVPHEMLIDRAQEMAESVASGAAAHTLSFRLHDHMLDEISAISSASAVAVERAALDRFDSALGAPAPDGLATSKSKTLMTASETEAMLLNDHPTHLSSVLKGEAQ